MIVANQHGELNGQTVAPAPGSRARLLPPGVMRPFVLVTSLFFLWGIPNSMNDVLIRQFMKSFAISRFQAGLVQSAFYLGYFLLALPAGMLMKRHGYKPGFLTGLLLLSTGCFLFLPAANSGRYGFFLAALFVVASGLAFLETASNPFVAQLGPAETAEQRLNLAQAFNPLGCITGILLGTAFIFSGVELSQSQTAAMRAAGTYAAYMHTETLRVVSPYLVLGALALVWAVMIGTTKFPAFLREREHISEVGGNWRDLLHKRHFLFAVLAQFLYCGGQVCTWSYFIQYCKEYGHTTDKLAGVLLAGCLVAFGLGRFLSTALMRRFSPGSIMMVYGLTNAVLLAIGTFWPSWPGLIAVLLTSFFLSVMFPTIFAMGLKDLGANTNIAGSFIVMAIVGGAVLTPLMGLLAEILHSTARAFIIPLLCNIAVAAYAWYMQGYDAGIEAQSDFVRTILKFAEEKGSTMNILNRRCARGVLALVAAVAACGLAGCGALQMQGTGVGGGSSLQVSGMKGTVYGGQQPITGAAIQLYAVGMTGYGSQALPLIPTSGAGSVTTDSGGYFSLPAYTCPSNSYVYITAAGGNPQLTPVGSANADIALMAALGSCATLQTNAATTFTNINEVTTIAGVWALQQFGAITAAVSLSAQPGGSTLSTVSVPTLSPSFTIGTSATNVQGLQNAFGIANVLANTSLGSTPGANTSGTVTNVETWQINTLANILASCVNSNPTGGDTGCTSLFTDATVGGVTPADTLQAAWMIAQNPGNNVQALFGLSPAVGAPFSSITDNFVNDWTIGFAITPSGTYGTDLGTSQWIAFDSFGNAWVTSSMNAASAGIVTEFDPQGNLIGSPITNYNLGYIASPTLQTIGIQPANSGSNRVIPFEVVIDASNNAWVSDRTNSAVFRIAGSSAAGAANGGGGAAAFAISPGASSLPASIAIDGNGIIWTALQGSTSGYSSTFGSSTTGLAYINPAGTTSGPLTGGHMSATPAVASGASYSVVVETTPTSTYAAAPFIDVINGTVTCTSLKYGNINQYFGMPATVNGSSSNTTVAQGDTTPNNVIADAGVSCSSAKATLPVMSTVYGGTTYSVPATYTPEGAAADGNGNLWVLNTAIVSSPTGYPLVGLSKLTPNYATSATTGALSATYTTAAVDGGGLPSLTTPEYIAIDGANNVWTTGQQTGSVLTSHAEFKNDGTPISPSAQTAIRTGTTTFASGWFGGNTGASTERLSQTRRAIAIDLSGNVWNTDGGSAGKALFVLVGAAAPTVTPLSVAYKNNAVGTKP